VKFSFFRILLAVLYVTGAVALIYVARTGWDYYSLPLTLRPRSDLHLLFKSSGMWGHTLGIIGSSMLILLFLYSARKRSLFGLRAGKLSRWLDIHIWFGIMGPALVTLHSTFKFNGFISISYFSMMAVMLSGFFGRYIYIQIPRDDTGATIPLREVDESIEELGQKLIEEYKVSPEVLKLATAGADRTRGGLGSVFRSAFSDLLRPLRSLGLRRRIARAHPELPKTAVGEIVKLADRRALLIRRRDVVQTMGKILHYWHVIHKPFAYVMIFGMVVHIVLVVAMGYTGIF
jgi:hypothetical protein